MPDSNSLTAEACDDALRSEAKTPCTRFIARTPQAGAIALSAALTMLIVLFVVAPQRNDSTARASTPIRLVRSRPVAPGVTPRFAIHVIGRLPGSEASLPQSIDSAGDVAGLSGAVSLSSPFGDPLLQYGGRASIFLYAGGRMRKIPAPHSTDGSPSPVNVVVVNRHRLAATFGTAFDGGSTVVRTATLRGTRVTWHTLPLPRQASRYGLDMVMVSSAGDSGKIFGIAYGGPNLWPIVWIPNSSGGYKVRYTILGSMGESLAGDNSFDLAGGWNWLYRPLFWASRSKRAYSLSLRGPGLRTPHVWQKTQQQPYANGVAASPAIHGGVQNVYVLGVDQVRTHVVDALLWTVGVRVGHVRQVVWATTPTVLGGVDHYRDMEPPDWPSASPIIGGSVTPDGKVAGTMGWWRRDHTYSECLLSLSSFLSRYARIRPRCWSSHSWLHGFLYAGGRVYDLNSLVDTRRGWVIEGATSGVPDADIFAYGSARNSQGDIIAVGYRNVRNEAKLRQCRTDAIWQTVRRLCMRSARTGPETALVLTPVK